MRIDKKLLKQFYLITIFLALFTCNSNQNKPLFSLLDSNVTQVYFNNKIEDELDRNYFLYDNFYGGAGVGVGDFNNDGLQDIYFAGNIVEDKLYLNKGGLKFEDITNEAGIIHDGGWSSGVAIADVNSDGYLDIFISRELYDDKPNLRRNILYINNQDLTFSNQIENYGLSDTVRTRHATFFDYDKDGDLDLFVLNQPPNPGNYSPFFKMVFDGDLIADEFKPILYRNAGGSFKDVSKETGINVPGYCNAAIASDFNNDGWVDLYVGNDFEVPDFLYINNQDGTFTDEAMNQMQHISYFSMGVDAADINNDGWLDIMALDMAFEGNYRSKANIGGMNPEKFMNFVKKGWHHQYMYNTLQLNNQNNSYSEIAQLTDIAISDWSWSNLIADLDNDGHKDIFITNGILRDIRNHDGELGLKKYINEQILKHHKSNVNLDSVSIWDIIDYKKALDYYPSMKISNYAIRNEGNLQFTNTSKNWGLDQPSFSNGSSYADLDNDGDLDLIVNNVNDNAFIYRNNTDQLSDNTHLRIELYKNEKPGSFFGAKAKIEVDGKIQYQELAGSRGMYSSSEHIFHFGVGISNSPISVTVTWPDGNISNYSNVESNTVLQIDYEDSRPNPSTPSAANDKLLVDISEKAGLNFKHLENQFDDFKKQPLLPHKMSSFGPAFAIGDVNADGLDDFFIGGSTGLTGQLFHQSEDGSFSLSQSMPWFQDRLCEDVGAQFIDADNDGDLDLYVVSGGNEFNDNSKYYQDRIYVNTGNGALIKSETSLPKIFSSGSRVISCDYDEDGDLDLFIGGMHKPWRYPEPVNSYILENISSAKDSPLFKDVTLNIAEELQNIGMVTDAVWTDYDNDSDQDLIVVGYWMPISIFQNDGSRFRKINDSNLNQLSGWWNCIEKGDLDGDGDDDYVVGNFGLNNAYKTNMAEPLKVNYGDFDNNGVPDFVMSTIEQAVRYPTCERSEILQQFPFLKEKFKDYHSYASASLEEVFGQSVIARTKQFEVSTFAHHILENKNSNNFEITKLPVESQLSSVNDIIIHDFDNDGNLDVLTGGNFHPVETSTPRNDAGIGSLIAGDGNGNLSPVHNTKSGLCLPYDLRQIGLANTTTGKVIIAANNSERVQIFRIDN